MKKHFQLRWPCHAARSPPHDWTGLSVPRRLRVDRTAECSEGPIRLIGTIGPFLGNDLLKPRQADMFE